MSNCGSAMDDRTTRVRGILRTPRRALAAAAVLAAFALLPFGAATFLAGAPHAVPAFLGAALGPADRAAPLLHHPAEGVDVAIDSAGVQIAHDRDSLILAQGSGRWQAHENGATRSMPFGSESVTVTPSVTEEFLTVAKHQGTKVWRWRLATTL